MNVKSMIAALALLAMSASAAHAAGDPSKCKLQKIVDLPVTMTGLTPVVTVKINGQDVRLIADSGAFFSLLSDQTAQRLGIKGAYPLNGIRVRGVGGGEADIRVGKAKDFAFGDLPAFHNIDFMIGGAPVGSDAEGLLGQNVLGAADVEYDLANGVIRLFSAKGCSESNLAYWSAGKALSRLTIPARTPQAPHIITPAKVDGKSIHVMFDSGAPVSYLSLPAAARVGIKPNAEGVVAGGVSHGVGRGSFETSLAPFTSFAIGDEEIKNTRLRVADLELDSADMLLGADFFLSHRIYVANSQHRLYFTYNGGPVFRLEAAKKKVAAASDAPADAPKTAVADADMDAAAFSRRGAASVSRRDYASAIADFTRAAELEPKDAHHIYDRAMAHLRARQPVLAMADFDQVLKLKPDDVDALVGRGELYLAGRDLPHAQADFDAALRQAADSPTIPLRVAGIYGQARLFPRAIALYTDWITAHPKDGRLAEVLDTRCWTRATWGQQLTEALADCNQALKVAGRNSSFLDSRAMVEFRLGDLDKSIADYDSALKMQPKSAWSLYGRGLAKQRKGLKTEGDADIAAAVALAPHLPETAHRMGLESGPEPTKPAT